jgi:hypothetical protein
MQLRLHIRDIVRIHVQFNDRNNNIIIIIMEMLSRQMWNDIIITSLLLVVRNIISISCCCPKDIMVIGLSICIIPITHMIFFTYTTPYISISLHTLD